MTTYEGPGGGLGEVFQLARALKQASGFLPPHLSTEGQIVAVILAGKELGLPPMVSLRSIRLIKGQVALDAAVQLGLMIKHGARVRWLRDGIDGKEAVLELQRGVQPPHQSRYTMEQAKTAKLLGSDAWQKHPAAMLRARAVSAAGRAYMPDVFAGVYNPDELGEPEPQAAPVLTVVPSLPVSRPEEAPQAPAKALPAPEGVPPDEPREETPSWAVLRELFQQQLTDCTTQEDLRAWLDKLGTMKIAPAPRQVLWTMFAEHATRLGFNPDDFKRKKGAR